MKKLYLLLAVLNNSAFIFSSNSNASPSALSNKPYKNNPSSELSSKINTQSNSSTASIDSLNASSKSISNKNPYQLSLKLIKNFNTIKSQCFSCEELLSNESITKAEYIDYMNEALIFCCENKKYDITTIILDEHDDIIESDTFFNMLLLSIKNSDQKLFLIIKNNKNFKNLKIDDFTKLIKAITEQKNINFYIFESLINDKSFQTIEAKDIQTIFTYITKLNNNELLRMMLANKEILKNLNLSVLIENLYSAIQNNYSNVLEILLDSVFSKKISLDTLGGIFAKAIQSKNVTFLNNFMKTEQFQNIKISDLINGLREAVATKNEVIIHMLLTNKIILDKVLSSEDFKNSTDTTLLKQLLLNSIKIDHGQVLSVIMNNTQDKEISKLLGECLEEATTKGNEHIISTILNHSATHSISPENLKISLIRTTRHLQAEQNEPNQEKYKRIFTALTKHKEYANVDADSLSRNLETAVTHNCKECVESIVKHNKMSQISLEELKKIKAQSKNDSIKSLLDKEMIRKK